MAEDDEFDDDGIDWSSVMLPPAAPSSSSLVTPANKRPRLDYGAAVKTNANDGSPPTSSSSLLRRLEVAPAFAPPSDPVAVGDAEDETTTRARRVEEEVGDELQLEAMGAARRGDNLFLTGRAGTGKSWTTGEIRRWFDDAGKVMHVAAPTGIAAINVGGM